MRQVLLFCCISFLNTVTLFAQDNFTTRKTTSPKVLKAYDEAFELVKTQKLDKALEILQKTQTQDPKFIDAPILMAQIKYDQGKYAESIALYQKALALGPDYRPRLYYQLALTQLNLEQYTDAITSLEQFLKREKTNQDLIRRAQKHLRNAQFAKDAVLKPVSFKPEKLPPSINTSEHNETLPSLSADGQTIIFTRRLGKQEDFFVSKKENGQWMPAQALAALNSELSEGGHSLSADGRTLVYTGCNVPGGLGSCDLYISSQQNGQWTPSANLKGPVNTRAWESQASLSADGKILFFASDRPGGLGGRDIWQTQRQSDGNWSTPSNLGATINTPDEDQAPFFHPDGNSLYFMSDGHAGMGGTDLFVARKQADGSWGKPQNLGYPINTRADEGALVVSLDGTQAYYTGGTPDGKLDIYTFSLPAEDRPQPVTYARGLVFDAKTQQSLAAKVELIDLATKQVLIQQETSADGIFLVCLPLGKNYALNVNKAQYLFYSDNFALQEKRNQAEPFELKVPLQAITSNNTPVVGQPVILKNVFFASGSAALQPESNAELQRLNDLLKQNPNLKIRIHGHTDNVGDDTTNQKLSEQRAKAVYDYLVQQGIPPIRLAYQGFGESKPIADNNTAEGRQVNRRTEFVVF